MKTVLLAVVLTVALSGCATAPLPGPGAATAVRCSDFSDACWPEDAPVAAAGHAWVRRPAFTWDDVACILVDVALGVATLGHWRGSHC